LLVLGLVGLFGGIIASGDATGTADRIEVARSELAAMATRICFLLIAIAGAATRVRRSLRLRPLIVVLALGLLALLGVEVARVRDFGWSGLGDTPNAADEQLAAPIYALAVLAIVELCRRDREIPRHEARSASIAAIRRIGYALVALAVVGVVVLAGAQLSPVTDAVLIAVVAAGAAMIALLVGVIELVRCGATRATRWLASIAGVLLTWSAVVHAIHGFLLYEQARFVYVSPEWLSGLTDIAPLVGSLGLIATVGAVAAMHRGPPEVVAIDRGPYFVVLWLVLASVVASVFHRALLPVLGVTDRSLPIIVFLHLVPQAAIAPFLFEAARDVDRHHAPDLAGARLT